MHDLYRRFAHRYDLHTPPNHYKADHRFVLTEAAKVSPAARLLDVGCGTGVLIEKALAAGLDAYGSDISAEMIAVAAARLGAGRVAVEPMQALSEVSAYDVVCLLSWTINYADGVDEMRQVVERCGAALRPGGLLLIQTANAAPIRGEVRIDREPGPNGEPEDTTFIYRFRNLRDGVATVEAEYVYASLSLGELLTERHLLKACDPQAVADAMRAAGLLDVAVVDPASISPFVVGKRMLAGAARSGG